MKHGLHLFIWLTAVLTLTLFFTHPKQAPAHAGNLLILEQPQPDPQLRALAQADGSAAVIVGFHVSGFSATAMAESEEEARAQQAAIARVRDRLLDRLQGQNITNIKTYDTIPYIAMTVDAAALQALYDDPEVTAVEEDFTVAPALSDSVPLIRAHFAHLILYQGSGQTVAILDTGVDKFHADLSGKVVSEACYSTNGGGFTSLCPGGASSSTAINSGLNCSLAVSGCHHGTHVAGIAAGVAPEANLIAIQVFSRTNNCGAGTAPCTRSQVSDILSGLNRVYALRNTFNIASVNMSLGSGQYFSTCDNVSSAMHSVVNLLRSVNISTVAASGNDGYRSSMGWPACHSNIISVGSTTKTDQVSDFSNIASFTTLLAPGSNIFAPMPAGWPQTHDSRSGTSMAAPHVAGSIAVLKSAQSTLTVPQISSHLVNGGILVTDQRPGGTITRRRLDVWGSICRIITCDVDDFRTMFTNQTLNGSINPSTDVDHYYYSGQAGQRLTLQLNRTSGTINPYLELLDPNGIRVAFNNDGGGGVNALINGYTLQQNGLYIIRARSISGSTGNYQLNASQETVAMNPVPSISYLSPPAATGTFFGSDFWVAIVGSNFMPESEVRWNGQLRAKFYSHSGLIYIRVLGSDIGFPWPRTAFITVSNPTPGGGTSNSRAFNINIPFLGESELVAPEAGSSLSTGISSTFVISWTHPISSWRTMQNMDIRLRNDAGQTAAWLRVSEGSPTSTLSLLNSSATPVISTTLVSGVQGSGPDLVIPEQVTLHTDQTIMFGSGRTIVISPTLTFGPLAVGTYNIEFMVDNEEGEVQADDVLGTIVIHPPGCPLSLQEVSLTGPATATVNTAYAFNATITPINATTPITYSWAPEPESGQGTANATYRWDSAGEKTLFLGVENCGTFVADVQSVLVSTTTTPDLSISKAGPATALASQPFTYTLTITNSGATTATNLLVRDVLPSGATYLGGGALVGDEVQWTIGELGGYGQTAVVSFTLSAATDVVNNSYSVEADGGYSAQNSSPVQTRIVDAQVTLTAVTTKTLHYAGAESTGITIPGGSVFADTVLVYDELELPSHPTSNAYAGRAFLLDGYQNNQIVPDLSLGETAVMTLTYDNADVAGLDESLLMVHYWTGSGWSHEGVNCSRDGQANWVACEVPSPSMTEFALLETLTQLYLPLISSSFPAEERVEITDVSIDSGGTYVVSFIAHNYTPLLPGTHIHFFFDTVPPDQAGMPGSGPWIIYGSTAPFTGYALADRPAGASAMCALVANQNHTVRPNSGNCYPLP